MAILSRGHTDCVLIFIQLVRIPHAPQREPETPRIEEVAA